PSRRSSDLSSWLPRMRRSVAMLLRQARRIVVFGLCPGYPEAVESNIYFYILPAQMVLWRQGRAGKNPLGNTLSRCGRLLSSKGAEAFFRRRPLFLPMRRPAPPGADGGAGLH